MTQLGHHPWIPLCSPLWTTSAPVVLDVPRTTVSRASRARLALARIAARPALRTRELTPAPARGHQALGVSPCRK
jgi:hypothetical protein